MKRPPLPLVLALSLTLAAGLWALPGHAQPGAKANLADLLDYANDPFDPTVARDAWLMISRAEQHHQIPSGLLHAMSLVETGQGLRGWMLPWPYTVGINGTGRQAMTAEAALSQLQRWQALGFVRFNLIAPGANGTKLRPATVRARLQALAPGTRVTLEGRNFARRFQNAAAAEQFLTSLFRQGYQNVDVGMMQINWRVHGKQFKSVREVLDPAANLAYAVNYLLKHRETRDWWGSVGRYHSGTPLYANRYVRNVYSMYLRIHRANNNA